MDYYFVTYQAEMNGRVDIWNNVINISPMQFIKEVEEGLTVSGHIGYHDFVVINTCEISKEDYERYKNKFLT